MSEVEGQREPRLMQPTVSTLSVYTSHNQAFFSHLKHRLRRQAYDTQLPPPIGQANLHEFSLGGLRVFDAKYVSQHPERLFARYQFWFLEVSDELLRRICPADLCNIPCPWDEEAPRHCRLLRMCQVKQLWQQDNSGRASCMGKLCPYLHDIVPTCRSLQDQVSNTVIKPRNQFRSFQTCKHVTKQSEQNQPEGQCCFWGHDLEGTRIEAMWNYFSHFWQAGLAGCTNMLQSVDAFRDKVVPPYLPSLTTLRSNRMDTDGKTFSGLTFHGHRVTMPMSVYEAHIRGALRGYERNEARDLVGIDSSLDKNERGLPKVQDYTAEGAREADTAARIGTRHCRCASLPSIDRPGPTCSKPHSASVPDFHQKHEEQMKKYSRTSNSELWKAQCCRALAAKDIELSDHGWTMC